MSKGAAMYSVNIVKQFIHIDYELCTHDSEHVCGTSSESGVLYLLAVITHHSTFYSKEYHQSTKTKSIKHLYLSHQ